MHQINPDIIDTMKKAPNAVLDEIIRQAEIMLSAQLTAALASDQRSIVFASVLAALFSVLVGAGATIVASGSIFATTLAWFLPMMAALAIAMMYAVLAARPIRFRSAGNNPRQWVDDIKSKSTLKQSRAETADLYAKAITENNLAMTKNARLLKLALWWSLGALVTGFIGLISALPI